MKVATNMAYPKDETTREVLSPNFLTIDVEKKQVIPKTKKSHPRE